MKRQFILTGEIVTLSSKVFRLSGSFSTASIEDAPREAASSAMIPDPEKISRKERPVKSPKQANTDSRI
jgi:archaellum component FlaG (FlaF/FlaG flagellin family)